MSEENTAPETVDTPEGSDAQESQEQVSSWFDSAPENWQETLPEGIGEHSALGKYKTPVDALKGVINAQELIGKKVSEFPGEDSTEEQVKEFYEKLGVPESVDGYNFELKDLPDGIEVNEDLLSSAKQFGLDNNLTPAQMENLVNFHIANEAAAYESSLQSIESQTNQSEEHLKEEWGRDFQKNVGQVEQALDYLGVKEDVNDMGLGRNAQFLQAVFDKIVPAISQDKLIEASKSDNFATLDGNLNAVDSWLESHGESHPDYSSKLNEKFELMQQLH